MCNLTIELHNRSFPLPQDFISMLPLLSRSQIISSLERYWDKDLTFPRLCGIKWIDEWFLVDTARGISTSTSSPVILVESASSCSRAVPNTESSSTTSVSIVVTWCMLGGCNLLVKTNQLRINLWILLMAPSSTTQISIWHCQATWLSTSTTRAWLCVVHLCKALSIVRTSCRGVCVRGPFLLFCGGALLVSSKGVKWRHLVEYPMRPPIQLVVLTFALAGVLLLLTSSGLDGKFYHESTANLRFFHCRIDSSLAVRTPRQSLLVKDLVPGTCGHRGMLQSKCWCCCCFVVWCCPLIWIAILLCAA